MSAQRNQRIGLASFGIGIGIVVVVVAAVAAVTLRHRVAPQGSSPNVAAEATPPTPPSPPGPGTPPEPPVVYDPTKLLENGVASVEVYDKEPRSDAWAEAAEGTIGGAMRRDLAAMVPGAAVVLKCRTLSCLVGVDAPKEKRETALAVTKFLMLAPWVVDLEPEEDGTMRWLFFQEPRFADPAVLVEWFYTARKRRLADIHAGKTPNPFPVALDQVPND